MKRVLLLAVPAVIGIALAAGCEKTETSTPSAGSGAGATGTAATTPASGGEARMDGKTAVAKITPSQSSTTQPTGNQPTGTVTFTQSGDNVKVVADISGLTPNAKHGFHIHEKGDLSAPDLASAGAHYNPDGHVHGGPTTSPVHAGDLGNLEADGSGKAHLEITLDDISIGGKNDIVGKSVIVHAKPDDLKSQPSGNSGGRIGGGKIEVQP